MELYQNHCRNWWSRTWWLLAVAMEIEHQLLSYPIQSKTYPLLSLIWVWKASNSHLNTRFSPNPNPYSLSDLGLKRVRVCGVGISAGELLFTVFSLFLFMALSWECRKRRGWGRGREQAWRWRDWWRHSRGWESTGALGRVREKLSWGKREEPWIFYERDKESENPWRQKKRWKLTLSNSLLY